MFLVVFLPVLVSCAFWNNRTVEQVPFFHGHVFENALPGSSVNGLSVPLKRINAHRVSGSSGDSENCGFKLLGDGSENFRAFLHHKRGQVLLKTCTVLDREQRAEYALGLGLCRGRNAAAAAATEEPGEEDGEGEEEEEKDRQEILLVASIKVDVLDTNDHQPTFPSAHVRLNLDDSTPLRTTVYAVTASDSDSGKNAELIYFTLPSNGSFYAVPKTGHILLVDSILGLSQPVRFQLFARDRGWPPRTSQSVSVEVYPKQFLVTETKQKVQQSRGTRRTRSALDPDKTLLINVSEDAGIGSVIMNLNPVRFQSATFELVEPADALKSALSVNRDSGDLIITRRLDRETEPLLEITVKVQDKRGRRSCVGRSARNNLISSENLSFVSMMQ